MTTTPLLQTRNAGLAYATGRGTITAVDGVTIEIAAGECVAIRGRSGSGKSTLLALLGGLCAPTSGEVLFAGRSWPAMRPAEIQAARAGRIGLMLQESVLLPGLRAIDNVMLPQLVAGSSREAACRQAEAMLARVGLEDRWDAYPAELSGGQQRRVALARALATEPDMILADEPTNDLDAFAEQEVVRILAAIRAAGTTAIVLVTHDPAVAAIADRQLWMERGRIVADGVAIDRATPHIAAPLSVPAASLPSVTSPVAAFEPASAGLVPRPPSVAFAEWRRTIVPFAVGLGVAGVAVIGIDRFVARRQQQAAETIRQQRRLAEEMALQDLRADIDDITPAGVEGFTATLFLENFRPERPLHVLGPATGVAVQREGRWESLPIAAAPSAAGEIRKVGAERLLVPVAFTIPEGPYDELLRGYLHVRISASMVVSDRADGAGDLFERADAYSVYLRDPRLTEEAIRTVNGWGAKAAVPMWIAMPAH